MKIYSPQLGLSPTSQFGGEVHDTQLISSLTKKGVEVKVLLSKGKKHPLLKNLKIDFLPIAHIVPPHLFNLIALPYILKEKYDILRIHSPYFLGLAAWAVRKISPETKIVTTIHLKETSWDLKWILKKTIHVYDHIFTVSQYLKDDLVDEFNLNPEKISVIYNGVNMHPEPKDRALIEKYGVKDKVVLLFVGQLVERKNPLLLVELMKRLYGGKIKLIICGSGPLKAKIKQQAIGLEEYITVIDPVYGKEKNKLFNLADIFMFPSLNEGFGLVVAEAMAVGKPVICSPNTSLPELVEDGVNGYLAGDITEWEEETRRLISNKPLREKMGQRGLRKSKQFNWDAVADKTLTAYKKLV